MLVCDPIQVTIECTFFLVMANDSSKFQSFTGCFLSAWLSKARPDKTGSKKEEKKLK
jgi:hypothetical protein